MEDVLENVTEEIRVHYGPYHLTLYGVARLSAAAVYIRIFFPARTSVFAYFETEVSTTSYLTSYLI